MCYKNVQKMPKSKTTPTLNGEHDIPINMRLLQRLIITLNPED
jgi:hypothetical protein